jgi:hypothetical protein
MNSFMLSVNQCLVLNTMLVATAATNSDGDAIMPTLNKKVLSLANRNCFAHIQGGKVHLEAAQPRDLFKLCPADAGRRLGGWQAGIRCKMGGDFQPAANESS